jgi:ribonuclease R
MIDKEQLYTFFKENPQRPWHVQDLQKRLKVSQRGLLRQLTADLVEEGRLTKMRRNTFGLPQEPDKALLLGRLQVASGGYGFLIPEKEGEKDLFIPADRLLGAWDGDRVSARPNPLRRENGRISGEIVQILTRKHERIVGTLEYSKGYAILRPDSPKLRERIPLTPATVGTLEAGSRIVGRLVWPETSGEKSLYADVEEVLGDGDNPEIETKAVIIKYDLKDEFEAETTAEAAAFKLDAASIKKRLDLRNINVFTIDGIDAKDFDDAISVERLGRGKTALLRVGIHIADVSYYVKEGSHLDRDAKDRATSVYLPGKVLPMLPEALSNGLCSLVEGEERLTLSVIVDLTTDSQVQKVEFKESIIKSMARLTYEGVQAFTDGESLPKGKKKLERDIKTLIDLSQTLRQQRIGQGALDFDFSEAKVDVDDEGALHLTPIKSNVARQLIEELMLLANRLVASELSKKDIPALYRVHEDPSTDKLQSLQKALAKFGYILDWENATSQDLQAVLKQVAGKPEASIVNTLLLRSLKQARYSPENLGHFGLAFEHYLHFTSPIRRYPDLVVHRILRLLMQRKLNPDIKERLKNDLPQIAEHTSERERNAEEAERDLTRYYHARWAKEHLGEVLSGVISGVTNFGVFVALPNGAEGLVHISQLEDDYYMFFEDSLMLLGKNKRRRFRMGERLEVKIVASNPVQRQIDLLPSYLANQERDKDKKETSVEASDDRSVSRPSEPKRPEPKHPVSRPPAPKRPEPRPKDREKPPVHVSQLKVVPKEKGLPKEIPQDSSSGPKEIDPILRSRDNVAPVPSGKKKRLVLIFGDPNRWKP